MSTLLKQLKDREALAQRQPVIEFNYPDDDKPQMIVRAKRLSQVEIREANKKIIRSEDGSNLSGFFEDIFKRVLPKIESIKDASGETYDIKETVGLMHEHFNSSEVIMLATQYQLALSKDNKEAKEDPNE